MTLTLWHRINRGLPVTSLGRVMYAQKRHLVGKCVEMSEEVFQIPGIKLGGPCLREPLWPPVAT
jgi:hypothetical protein